MSLNKILNDNRLANSEALNRAHEALVGYALRQTPAGILPCPDTDLDGLENTTAIGCQSQRAWLPYRTLGLGDLRDQSGTLLWYAVEPNITVNAIGTKNSNTSIGLSLDNQSVVAVVIAPGRALPSQQRTNNNVVRFLEGSNADADLDTYARAPLSENFNDELVGVTTSVFWSTIERRVLAELFQSLSAYRTDCGEYPWAAAFGVSPTNSVASQQGGAIPLGTALPANWGSGCALNVSAPAAWLSTHWDNFLYYRFCLAASANCVVIQGDVSANRDIVLLGPGIALSGNTRPSTDLSDYYEGINNSDSSPFIYTRLAKHDANYNDTTFSATGP